MGSAKISFGVGMDLSPGGSYGFHENRLTPKVQRFIETYRDDFSHFFFSFQKRGRSELDADEYLPAFDHLLTCLPNRWVRTLHHTLLNLGTTRPYDRSRIFALTNVLIERYDLKWINEDLGIWSSGGRPLPYPLPPLLTETGLSASIDNVRECMEGLKAPVHVEFPGFADGASVWVGEIDAYDFFRELVEQTGVRATLDVGHLLSWRWVSGARGESLYSELERLPLDFCHELHLSGCSIRGSAFIDGHHGVLLPEQLELTRRLVEVCPNLKAITYEDPRYGAEGRLTRKSLPGYEELRRISDRAPGAQSLHRPRTRVASRETGNEEELMELLFEATRLSRLTSEEIDRERMIDTAASVRRFAFMRSHLGSGKLTEAFSRTIAAYRSRHPDDPILDVLAAAFLESPEYRASRELPFSGRGISIEEAFGRFALRTKLASPGVVSTELELALLNAVLPLDNPDFELPGELVRLETGVALVFTRNGGLEISALINGRHLRGAIDPQIHAALRGLPVAPAVLDGLRKLGLVPRPT